MGASKEFFRNIARHNPGLLEAIVSFNRDVPGRLRRVTGIPDIRAFLAEGEHARHFARALPLLVAGASAAWTGEFALPRHRLALLPPGPLEKLGLWYGLVVHRQEVTALIDRPGVTALRETIGEEGYAFALRRTALLAGPRMAPPDLPGTQAPPLAKRIVRAGREALAACLTDAAPLVREKLFLTLDPEFTALWDAPGKPDPEAAWPLLRTLAVKEIAPQWRTLFI